MCMSAFVVFVSASMRVLWVCSSFLPVLLLRCLIPHAFIVYRSDGVATLMRVVENLREEGRRARSRVENLRHALDTQSEELKGAVEEVVRERTGRAAVERDLKQTESSLKKARARYERAAVLLGCFLRFCETAWVT